MRFHSITELFVCVEVLCPSQPNGVMSRAVSGREKMTIENIS